MSEEHGTLEELGGYSKEVMSTPISNCPYCGGERQIIHFHDEMYTEPDSYMIEHKDDMTACKAGCPDVMFDYSNLDDAVRHANMRAGE